MIDAARDVQQFTLDAINQRSFKDAVAVAVAAQKHNVGQLFVGDYVCNVLHEVVLLEVTV